MGVSLTADRDRLATARAGISFAVWTNDAESAQGWTAGRRML